jgi:hypothetical protein
MSGGNTKGDGSGDVLWQLVDLLGRLRIFDEWESFLEAEENVNDSDKELLVDIGYEWILQSIWVELTTSADVGDRQIEIEIQDDSDDVVMTIVAGIVQAASLTRYYSFYPGAENMSAFVGPDSDHLSTNLPALLLDESYGVRIVDSAVIAVGADDMVVQMLVKRRAKEA